MANVAFARLGFCSVLVKPPGPVQLKGVPTSVVPRRFNVPPTHEGRAKLGTAVGAVFFTKENTGVCVVPKLVQVTSTTNCQVPAGIAAVGCPKLVPSIFRVGLPTGP